ncbi:MAG: hypothetical protein KAS23_07830, partial [Anaerohalosphaera sp.]|nr:hypothetical protein [Anaerohalosphaera sp.]
RQGESLIIGGIRKVEKRSVVRGVPFLKDIPLLGILFSSKDFEERGKEILFILTPTISSGGVPNDEMVDLLRDRHDMAVSELSLVESITDPFGTGKYTDMIEEEATAAEIGRVKAEIEKTHIERKAQWLTDELRKAKEQVTAQQEMAEKTQNKINDLKAEVDRTRVEAQALVEAQKASEQAQKANQPKPDKAAETPGSETPGATDADKKEQNPPPVPGKETPPDTQPPVPPATEKVEPPKAAEDKAAKPKPTPEQAAPEKKAPDTNPPKQASPEKPADKEQPADKSFTGVSFRPLEQKSDPRLADQ